MLADRMESYSFVQGIAAELEQYLAFIAKKQTEESEKGIKYLHLPVVNSAEFKSLHIVYSYLKEIIKQVETIGLEEAINKLPSAQFLHKNEHSYESLVKYLESFSQYLNLHANMLALLHYFAFIEETNSKGEKFKDLGPFENNNSQIKKDLLHIKESLYSNVRPIDLKARIDKIKDIKGLTALASVGDLDIKQICNQSNNLILVIQNYDFSSDKLGFDKKELDEKDLEHVTRNNRQYAFEATIEPFVSTAMKINHHIAELYPFVSAAAGTVKSASTPSKKTSLRVVNPMRHGTETPPSTPSPAKSHGSSSSSSLSSPLSIASVDHGANNRIKKSLEKMQAELKKYKTYDPSNISNNRKILEIEELLHQHDLSYAQAQIEEINKFFIDKTLQALRISSTKIHELYTKHIQEVNGIINDDTKTELVNIINYLLDHFSSENDPSADELAKIVVSLPTTELLAPPVENTLDGLSKFVNQLHLKVISVINPSMDQQQNIRQANAAEQNKRLVEQIESDLKELEDYKEYIPDYADLKPNIDHLKKIIDKAKSKSSNFQDDLHDISREIIGTGEGADYTNDVRQIIIHKCQAKLRALQAEINNKPVVSRQELSDNYEGLASSAQSARYNCEYDYIDTYPFYSDIQALLGKVNALPKSATIQQKENINARIQNKLVNMISKSNQVIYDLDNVELIYSADVRAVTSKTSVAEVIAKAVLIQNSFANPEDVNCAIALRSFFADVKTKFRITPFFGPAKMSDKWKQLLDTIDHCAEQKKEKYSNLNKTIYPIKEAGNATNNNGQVNTVTITEADITKATNEIENKLNYKKLTVLKAHFQSADDVCNSDEVIARARMIRSIYDSMATKATNEITCEAESDRVLKVFNAERNKVLKTFLNNARKEFSDFSLRHFRMMPTKQWDNVVEKLRLLNETDFLDAIGEVKVAPNPMTPVSLVPAKRVVGSSSSKVLSPIASGSGEAFVATNPMHGHGSVQFVPATAEKAPTTCWGRLCCLFYAKKSVETINPVVALSK